MFANIPEELTQLRQWVVWRAVDLGTGRVQKLPYNAFDPRVAAKANDPTTWSDYDQALAATQRDSRLGLGFVFTANDPYVGIDIDDGDGIAAEIAEKRAEVVADIIKSTTSYMERSPSGKGLHIIARGKLPSSALVVRSFKFEVYAALRFFTMTGDMVEGRNQIGDEQAILNDLVEAFPKSERTDYEEATLGDTEAFGRRLDLSNQQVLDIAWHQPGFAERWNGQHYDWSLTHKQLIGDLDKISGRPEQVREMVHNSPLVLETPAKNGVTRLAKSQRLFFDVLAEVRETFEGSASQAWYTLSPTYVAHGRELAELLHADFERKRQLEAERQREILEQLRSQSTISRDSAGLLDKCAELVGSENLVVSRPPGIMGEMVLASEQGSWYPFTPYALPITLAIFSGFLGRRYKINRSGLNLNFILAAYSGTGKSDHARSWRRYLNRANERLAETNRLQQPRSRLLIGAVSSIQGFMDDLNGTWSATWVVDEAYSMVRSMMDERNATGTQLRNSFNEIYDASDRDGAFKPPASRANKKHESAVLVRNFNLSTFWTMTPEELENFIGSVTNGLMSRMVLIRENKEFGVRNSHPQDDLPGHLQGTLDALLSQSTNFDVEFDASPEKGAAMIYNIMLDYEATELMESIQTLIDTTMRQAIAGDIPKDYLLLNRLGVNALKIAGTLAAVQSPYSPVIALDQLRWAFGYVAQHMLTFLSDVDQGEVGEKADDDVLAVVRKYKELAKKLKVKGERGIPKREFHNRLRADKPFKTIKGGGMTPSVAATRTLDHMVEMGMLELVESERRVPGRKLVILCPTDHPVWG